MKIWSTLCLSMILLTVFAPTTLTSYTSSLIINDKEGLVISGLSISGGNITVINSRNIVIKDNNISGGNLFGIFVYNSSNITIVHNRIYNSSYDGITVRKSANVKIDFNYIANNKNGNGISIWDNSENVTISKNILINNQYGVFILSSSNVNITDNTILNTSYYSIYIYNSNLLDIQNNTLIGSDVGVELQYASSLLIFNNNIIRNSVGIYIGNRINNISIIGNLVEDSEYYGILIYMYPQLYSWQSNKFMNNKINFLYAFNTTLPGKITSPPPTVPIIRSTTSGSPYVLKYLVPLIVAGIILVSLLVIRKGKR